MRLFSRFSLGILLSLLLFLDGAFGSLMLGSLLMALKGSLFAGKMGMGGLLAMIYAASQNNPNTIKSTTGSLAYVPHGISSLGRKRSIRSVANSKDEGQIPNVSESKLEEIMHQELIPDSAVFTGDNNKTGNGSYSGGAGVHLSVEKLAEALNDTSSPVTQRVMRQVAILDQLSCLPKVICGMNTRTPSSKTNLINDYGYLIKFLFERDSNDDDKEDDYKDDDELDDDPEADDEEDDSMSRAEAIIRKVIGKRKNEVTTGGNKLKSKSKLSNKSSDGGKKKPSKEDDDDEDEDDDVDDDVDEEDEDHVPRNDPLDDVNSDDKLAEMAQESLIDDEPEMLRYVLAEMKQKMKKNKYAVDHSHLPGYDPDSYHTPDSGILNTQSSQDILNGGGGISSWYGKGAHLPSPYGDNGGKGVTLGNANKGFQIKWGSNEKNEEEIGFLGSLLPSFSFTKTKGSKGSGSDDDFANDPFFAGFKRSLKLKLEKDRNERAMKGEVEGQTRPRSISAQRVNSKFKRMDDYIAEKKEEIRRSVDPLAQYRVAQEAGAATKSARQCRLLFAKCPYEFSEIMTMIDNVKKLVTSQATVGDQQVSLKTSNGDAVSTLGSQSVPVATPAFGNTVGHTISSGGSLVNVHTGNGGSPGITSIMHQLENGDKVEIMLKIKPKDPEQTRPTYTVIPVDSATSNTAALVVASPPGKNPDPQTLAAHKNLYEMKKAIQKIAKIHNETELKLMSIKEKQQQQQQVQQLLSAASAAGSKPKPAESKVKVNEKQEDDKDQDDDNDNDNENAESSENDDDNGSNSNSSSQQDKSSEEDADESGNNSSGGGGGGHRKKPAKATGGGTGGKHKNRNKNKVTAATSEGDEESSKAAPGAKVKTKPGATATVKPEVTDKDKDNDKDNDKKKEETTGGEASKEEGEGSEEEEDEDEEGEVEDEDGDHDIEPIGRDHLNSNLKPNPSPNSPSQAMRYPGMGYGPGSQAHLYRRTQQINPNSGPFVMDYRNQATNSYPHPPITQSHPPPSAAAAPAPSVPVSAPASVSRPLSSSKLNTGRINVKPHPHPSPNPSVSSNLPSKSTLNLNSQKTRAPIALPPKPSPYRILKKRPRVEKTKDTEEKPKLDSIETEDRF